MPIPASTLPLTEATPGYLDRVRWIEVSNTESEAAPGGALLRTTGGDSDGTIRIAKPDADGQSHLMIAHPNGVPASGGGVGLATYTDLVPAAYDTGDGTPAVGDTWGSEAGGWKLRKDNAGYRVTSTAVSSNGLNLVEVQRDQSGADASIDGGGPGIDAAGFTDICKVTSGGNITDIKLRRKYGRMFRCVSVDECCSSAWWCVSNEQVTLTTACCTPATITRIIRLAFTSKTGDCTDLPDLVYLVHTGGTDLTWTNGTAADFWGIRTYSATFTISCSGATPKGTLTITDFTGGATTTIPCDLTSTGVALGTFTYSGSETDSCGNTTALSGTVAIAVSSWEDGGGVAVTGVVEFGEDEVPPWDATGPYKTEAEATACCVPTTTISLLCTEVICEFPVQVTYYLSFRNATGVITNQEITCSQLAPPFENNWYGPVDPITGAFASLTAQCYNPPDDIIQFIVAYAVDSPYVGKVSTVAEAGWTTAGCAASVYRFSNCAGANFVFTEQKIATISYYSGASCTGSVVGTAEVWLR